MIDFDDPRSNSLVVSTEVTYRAGHEERRYDLVLWVNGFPLVVGETKTPISTHDVVAERRERHPRRLRGEDAGLLRAQRAVVRDRGQGPPLRSGAPAAGDVAAVVADDRRAVRCPGMASVLRSAELLLAPELLLDILRTYTLFSRRSSTARRLHR